MAFAVGNRYPIIKDGLVLYLDAKQYSGSGTTWFDLSNTNNDATIVGNIIYNSEENYLRTVDTSYVTFYATDLSNIATIEFFAKIPNQEGMMMSWDAYTIFRNWQGDFGFNTYGSDVYGISSQTVQDLNLYNTWKHYVFEMRTDVSYVNNKMYINGENQILSQHTGSEQPGNRSFNGGNGKIAASLSPIWFPYFIQMEIKMFRVYNRSLTESEILKNFKSTTGYYI